MAYTQLSPEATPGIRRSFLPKGAGHVGLFTGLSASGLPGKRHVFLAKSIAEEERSRGRSFFEEQNLQYEKALQEENEVLGTIIQAFISGVFD